MILTSCNPNRLVPYHVCEPERLQPYPDSPDARHRLPRIPVFATPPDLEYAPGRLATGLGEFILYNGHHRRMAAVRAGIPEVLIAVLESDEDLDAIESWEVLKLPTRSLADHVEALCKEVVAGTVDAMEDQRRILSLSGTGAVTAPDGSGSSAASRRAPEA